VCVEGRVMPFLPWRAAVPRLVFSTQTVGTK
jgi:hypothetical protein